MAKKTELLNSFSNTNKAAVVQRIESAPAAQGGYYTVFFGQEGLRSEGKMPGFTDTLRAEIEAAFPETQILAHAAPDGKRAIIVYSEKPLKEITEEYAQYSQQKFTQDERVIPFNERYELTKWRGHLGNIGQLFITLSGLGLNKWVSEKILGAENVSKKDKFKSPDKVISSIASTMGNGLNSWFGVQRKPDQLRLEVIKGRVNEFILNNGADLVNLPAPADRLTHYTWRERPKTSDQKTQVFFEQNAGIMSEVLKIVGKYSYFVGGQKSGNDGDKAHGAISMAAKFVTVLGKDEDPYALETKPDWFTKLRQRSNLISGGMEWIANISQFAGALASKVPAFMQPDHVDGWDVATLAKYGIDPNRTTVETKDGKQTSYLIDASGSKIKGFVLLGKDQKVKERKTPSPSWQMVDWKNSYLNNWRNWDWLQLIGATFFTLSLTTKMMATFTEKKVNVEEMMAHNAIGLTNIPAKERAQKAAELTAHLMEMHAPSGLRMLPEVHRLGFAATFAGMADKLYLRHEQDVTKPESLARSLSSNAEKAVSLDVEQEVTESKAKEEPVLRQAVREVSDRIQEARNRGEGAFSEKFGLRGEMTLGTSHA